MLILEMRSKSDHYISSATRRLLNKVLRNFPLIYSTYGRDNTRASIGRHGTR